MEIKKGGWNLPIVLLFILIILLVPEVSKAASDSNLSIQQVESKLPDVTLFVCLDNVDRDSTKLIKKNLSIRINDTPTQITDIQSVKNGNRVIENTAYLVLVDTSVSKQNLNQVSELQNLLGKLLSYVGPDDKTAVFGVSNTLETIKDFMVTDSLESVTNKIRNAISSNSGAGTYLSSWVRDAYDKGRMVKDLPTRRIIVIITDGGIDGASYSSEDIKNYVDVDRLPVYTLILNEQSTIDKEFKATAEQIAQKTGGRSFLSSSGNELFTQFKASVENCSVIKLRCDAFKAFNLQAVINVAFQGDQGEITQAAKFTATPAPIDKAVGNSQQNLRTSYYGVAIILIPILITLVLSLALLWMLRKTGGVSDKTKFK